MKMNERVKMLMSEKGLNQKELASKSGITEASMSKYLSGDRTPRIDILVNVANALGVTTDDLIGNDIENNKMELTKMKIILARGMKSMSEDEKKELIRFILDE
ncbi:MAG: helix-turn-helix transcriptional regulator [Bacilli bacterium]